MNNLADYIEKSPMNIINAVELMGRLRDNDLANGMEYILIDNLMKLLMDCIPKDVIEKEKKGWKIIQNIIKESNESLP